MRIGLLVPELPPDTIGGGGAVFRALAEQLAARGHEVRVVTSHTHGGPWPDRAETRFEVLRLREVPQPAPAYRTYMPPYPWELLRAHALLDGCDVVNAHGHGHPLVDLLTTLSVPSTRTVYSLHGFLYSIPKRGGVIARAYGAYDDVLGKRALRRSRRVTAVSSAVASEAARRGRPDTIVINNGFEPFERTPALPERIVSEMRKGPYLLGIGRLEELKGFDIALEALRALRKLGIPLRLLVAGRDNGSLATLRALAERLDIAESVSFTGFVQHAQLPALYREAFAYTLTSRTEAFPAAPLEAMSLRAPCVLARVGGVTDIATDDESALLFESEDSAGMAAAVSRLWHDPALVTRLTVVGVAVSARFAWPAIAAAYEAVLSSVGHA